MSKKQNMKCRDCGKRYRARARVKICEACRQNRMQQMEPVQETLDLEQAIAAGLVPRRMYFGMADENDDNYCPAIRQELERGLADVKRRCSLCNPENKC